MADSPKIRVAAYAAENKITTDAILAFLAKQKIEVKSINSPLSPEAVEVLNSHFKKEIDKEKNRTNKYDKLKEKIEADKVKDTPPKDKKGKGSKRTEAEEEADLFNQPVPATEEAQQEETDAAPEVVEVQSEAEPETQPEPETPAPAVEVSAEPVQQEPVAQPETPVVPAAPEAPVQEAPAVQETPAPRTMEEKAPEVKPQEVTLPFGGTTTEKVIKPQPRPENEQKQQPKQEKREHRNNERKQTPFVAPNERVQQKRGDGLTILGTFKEKEKKPVPPPNQQHGKPNQPNQPNQKGGYVFTPEPDDLESKKKADPKKKVKVKPKDDKTAKAAPVKKLKPQKFTISADEIEDKVKETTLLINAPVTSSNRQKMKKRKKQERQEKVDEQIIQAELDSKKIQVTEFIAVNEISTLMNVSVASVIEKFFRMGKTVTINQRLDLESIEIIADEFGFEIDLVKEYSSDVLEDYQDKEEDLKDRAPIVTIMGHVDHGKTSLLDYIRRANVVAGEAGGITQHIGAYRVDVGNGRMITFLDTPGHEAFTSMRARGAMITDIVILVVAADDAVMPQTIEAINHAKAANVPIVVAINKIDKPGVNIERIRQQLADRDILVEDWGGKYQSVQLSAKTGLNVDLLLEKILIEADLLQLKANPDRNARGVIIEAELDKGKGVTTTVLVQKGTLRVGDPFIAGNYFGRVRAMFDERKRKVEIAGPATPVQILGLEGTPQAGDVFVHIPNEREAREVALKRQQIKREQDHKQVHHITLDEISKQISIGGVKELTVIVKGDVDGSVEAIADSLMKLSNQEVIVKVIHRGVGAISESDVLLAAASNAIIVGFHVRPNPNARKLAEAQKVDIRLYNIIYNAISEVKSALEGLLSPIISEEVTGTAEVRQTFKVPKIGMVAGCYIQDGRINRSNRIRVIRDGIVVFEGELSSLKHIKDDIREALAGHECGIGVYNFNDIKVGDVIEAFKVIETKKKL